MIHNLGEHVRRFLVEHGLWFGMPTITGGVAYESQGHGLSMLSTVGILVGIVSALGNLTLKVLEYRDRRNRRSPGEPPRCP